jgi:hypothetical protein
MNFRLACTFVLFTSTAFAGDAFQGWVNLRRGVNVYSESSDSDLEAAKSYGIKTVRLGSVGEPCDFKYLIDKDGQWDLSKANLDRLKATARRFKKHGLEVILTLTYIPGRLWHPGNTDLRIFQDPSYQQQFFSAWKTIASALKDEDNIAGYDLINEPQLPEEVGQETTAINYAGLIKQIQGKPSDINEFYRSTIAAIREVDPKTPVILEATGTGDFSSIAVLKPSSDPHVLYSFHYYEPFPYYRGKVAHGHLVYPGHIPFDGPLWNRKKHRKNFEKVNEWCKANSIRPGQIYLGEFGAWADAIGAETYLQDVTGLADEFGWSWTHYSFRENAFPHDDLELEGHLKIRADTALFEIVRRKFR